MWFSTRKDPSTTLTHGDTDAIDFESRVLLDLYVRAQKDSGSQAGCLGPARFQARSPQLTSQDLVFQRSDSRTEVREREGEWDVSPVSNLAGRLAAVLSYTHVSRSTCCRTRFLVVRYSKDLRAGRGTGCSAASDWQLESGQAAAYFIRRMVRTESLVGLSVFVVGSWSCCAPA